MNFVVVEAGRWPRSLVQGTFYLKADSWDDYSFKTLFELSYVNEKEERVDLGNVKIMTSGMTGGRVSVPSFFSNLTSEYCSLGQGQDYYEQVAALPDHVRRELLTALRDCVADPSIWEAFQGQPAMHSSLLRSIDAHTASHTFRNILQGISTATPYRFRFTSADITNTALDFDVVPNSTPPTNIHVIIGRNGVGKTRLLSGLSQAAGSTLFHQASGDGMPGRFEFLTTLPSYPYRPAEKFANLVTVAFSAFDRFKPLSGDQFSGDIKYSYVGLKRQTSAETEELKSGNDLNREFAEALQKCMHGPRHDRWRNVVRILNSDPGFAELGLEQLQPDGHEDLQHAVAAFATLSSGHRIVALTAAKLVELVDERTLVLLDEPESHLHPPLLGSLMRALSTLLVSRNGVAIVATHSPVVLQEVPRECVWVLRRTGPHISAERPSVETFAENVGELTREVFQLELTDSGYHKLLRDSTRGRNFLEVMQLFQNRIGTEGQAVVRSLSRTTLGDSA